MNDNHIEIKEQRKDWFIKGILLLVLMIVSITLTMLPFLSDGLKPIATVFYLIGGLAFTVFTITFVYNIYAVCNPKVTLVLNAHGFIDKSNVGENIEVEWTNISSVKILGQEDMPFLGISFDNTDVVLEKMKPKLANEMRENINENLPPILIAQNEVKASIKDLKELFSKFTREARALQNDTPKKPKNNPFSTDDVLRTFGKLPTDEKVDDTATREFNIDNIAPKEKLDTSNTKEKNNEPNVKPNVEELQTTSEKKNDAFFDELLSKAAANIQPAEKDDQVTENNIADEISQLLSKTKSSKIDELGKILTNTDNSSACEENTSDSQIEETKELSDESTTETGDSSVAQTEETTEIANDISAIEINDNKSNNADSDNFEITLETMINQSLRQNEEKKPATTINQSDLEMLVNELDNKVQKKKKNFILQQKEEQ